MRVYFQKFTKQALTGRGAESYDSEPRTKDTTASAEEMDVVMYVMEVSEGRITVKVFVNLTQSIVPGTLCQSLTSVDGNGSRPIGDPSVLSRRCRCGKLSEG